MGRLVGDVFLSTAFLSYSGPFNQDYRALLNKNWQKELKNRKIPFTADLNIISMLVPATTVRHCGCMSHAILNLMSCGHISYIQNLVQVRFLKAKSFLYYYIPINCIDLCLLHIHCT